MDSIILRHLCFTGPEKRPAVIEFNQGLNVLYGASDTGKSFILEAIDFMLGGNTALRDIPEKNGYDRIFLGIQTSHNEAFTLVRSTQGGNFQLFVGLHQIIPLGQTPRVLSQKHSVENSENVSSFLLEKIGLQGQVLRKNVRGVTRSVSFRDLSHICIIDETEIQKKGSPVEASNLPSSKTVEYSLFKLLLTGVDDSSIVSSVEAAELSRLQEAQIIFIDELLSRYSAKLPPQYTNEDELRAQQDRLEFSISEGRRDLNAAEIEYQELNRSRETIKSKVEEGTFRRLEIDEIKARFALLSEHYQTDLERLDSISEAGTLLTAINPKSCPLCGALPDHQHPNQTEEGNIEIIVNAAIAESQKIKLLQGELSTTMEQLDIEANLFDETLPRINHELNRIEASLQTLRNNLSSERVSYAELVEKRSEIRETLSLLEQINDLSERKAEITLGTEGQQNTESTEAATLPDLSTFVLDEFAQLIEGILNAWDFPESNRVQFDVGTKDLIIAGKRRGSRGKGLRAITHAAFVIGVLQFCKSKLHPHTGFLLLDSPLLAYREPENSDDDLSETNVQDKFYEYLSSWTDRQIIIIENVTPPDSIRRLPNSQFFSKNDQQGRYGFFPN